MTGKLFDSKNSWPSGDLNPNLWDSRWVSYLYASNAFCKVLWKFGYFYFKRNNIWRKKIVDLVGIWTPASGSAGRSLTSMLAMLSAESCENLGIYSTSCQWGCRKRPLLGKCWSCMKFGVKENSICNLIENPQLFYIIFVPCFNESREGPLGLMWFLWGALPTPHAPHKNHIRPRGPSLDSLKQGTQIM